MAENGDEFTYTEASLQESEEHLEGDDSAAGDADASLVTNNSAIDDSAMDDPVWSPTIIIIVCSLSVTSFLSVVKIFVDSVSKL